MQEKFERKIIRNEFGERQCDVIDTPDDRIIEVKHGKHKTRLSMKEIDAQAGPYKTAG